ncbi:killer cell lectin-like receptor 3 [Ursus maritimus]|uniref:Killer cell lectin-like receptor 3 n=1 Tax=Ursus maritimus TaxID=29073 RepID=A0A8M1GTI2_URSMA|nr:killer cell lectin-like receptor 3 [Ursus maritimus]XP_040498092.1 killer cell lectin-like receptor 3 [Ursus maritimus]
MSNEQVIYSTLRFLRSPSESPNRLRPGGTQRPGKTDDTGFSVPWHLISVTLGILCLLLLVTVALLGTKIFQYIQENHQQKEEIGNLTREHHILQNESYLKERLLTNKTLEYNILKNESLQQKKEQDLLFSGKLCENRLSYRGIKYYYFIPESQNWKGCKQTCQSYNSSLLKINDEDELAFIQPQTCKNNYWIGLSYDDREQKWKWIDTGPPFGINYTFMSSSGRGQCTFLSATRTTPAECSNTYSCICEGRIDDVVSAHFNSYKNKRERDSQPEREHKQGEWERKKQAPTREGSQMDAGLDPRTPGSRPKPIADA